MDYSGESPYGKGAYGSGAYGDRIEFINNNYKV